MNDLKYRNDGAEFGASIYQRVSDDLEAGVSLNWAAGSNATRFGLGAKYVLDRDSSVSVCIHYDKVRNVFQSVLNKF